MGEKKKRYTPYYPSEHLICIANAAIRRYGGHKIIYTVWTKIGTESFITDIITEKDMVKEPKRGILRQMTLTACMEVLKIQGGLHERL